MLSSGAITAAARTKRLASFYGWQIEFSKRMPSIDTHRTGFLNRRKISNLNPREMRGVDCKDFKNFLVYWKQ